MGPAPDGDSPQLGWMGHTSMGAVLRDDFFEDDCGESRPGDPQRSPIAAHGDAACDWNSPASQVDAPRCH